MKAFLTRSWILLACFCVASATSSTAFSQEELTKSDFTEIAGKVVDSSNKPIEKFKINIAIYDYGESGWTSPKKVGNWDGEFENGEFSFDIEEPLEYGSRTYISRAITAEGYLETNRNGGWTQLSNFDGKMATIKLARGVKISGTVALPEDHADEQPTQPKVYVTKKMSGLTPDWNNRFQKNAQLDEEGKFTLTVPENCKLMVTAHASNAAATTEEFKVPKSKPEDTEVDLGEIKLKPGVSLSGVVLDRDGDPVAGQIVRMQQRISHGRYMTSTVYGHAQSDSDGKFTLPPRLGKCDITLVEQGIIGDVQTKAKGDVLMTKPIKLTLKEGVTPDDIEIKEGNTWKIHGTVAYEGEAPTVNFQMGSGSQKNVELDSEGQFEIEVVEGVTPWIMMYKSGEGTYYEARLSTQSLRKFRKHFSGSPEHNSQFFQFKKVTSDIGPLEFRMVKHITDTRTMMEMFTDWYFIGDDE